MDTTQDLSSGLQTALAALLEAEERGEAIDVETWAARYPQVADELRNFFANRQRFAAVAGLRPQADEVIAATLPGAASSAPAPGDRIRYFGDYELLAEIARGGMGVVYRARQKTLNRTVALKMILSGQFANSGEVQRFRREAEAAAALDHPNIIPIYEVGEHEGQQYFTMKLVTGGNLAEALTTPAWTPGPIAQQRRAAELVASVAQAVHHAHLRGILHRDLKPANVLLADDTPLVTDFGLAKHTESARDEFTRTGAIVGTPAYMAPEQATATKQLTTAADVYSLGAILYTALTGQPPFQGKSAYEVLTQVIEREPASPRQLVPTIDADLATICLKCLSKDPAQRYASAQALAEELERWLRGVPIQARPISRSERLRRWCLRNPVVAALGFALVVTVLSFAAGATLAMLKIVQEKDEGTQRLARLYVEKGMQAISENRLVEALPWFIEALRTDGSHSVRTPLHEQRVAAVLRQTPRVVCFWAGAKLAGFRPGHQQLFTATDQRLEQWTWPAGQPVGVPTILPDEISYAAYTPDGRHLVVQTVTHFCVVEAGSGKPVYPPQPLPPLTKNSFEYSAPVVSMDGQRLVLQSWGTVNREVYRASAQAFELSSGKPRGPQFQHDLFDRGEVLLSPCGRYIATTNTHDSSDENDKYALILWDLDTGKPRWKKNLRQGSWRYATALAFSPDGTRLLAGTDRELAVYAVASGDELLSNVHDTEQEKRDIPHRVLWSTDGRRIAAAYRNTVILLDAETLKPVGDQSLEHGSDMTFSPRRPRIYTERSGRGGDGQRFGHAKRWDAEDGTNTSIDFEFADSHGTLFFSGDDELIGIRSGFYVQVVAAADGSAQTPCLPHISAKCAELSPDGRWLLTAGAGARLWDLATARDELEPLPGSSTDPARFADFSRYGETVATLHPQGRLEIWEQHNRTSRWFKVEPDWSEARLDPTGQHLILVRKRPQGEDKGNNGPQAHEIQILKVANGQIIAPQPLGFLEVLDILFTPDGRHALVIDRETPSENAIASSFIHRIELAPAQKLESIRLEQCHVYEDALSADGRWLALASRRPHPDSSSDKPKFVDEVQIREVGKDGAPTFVHHAPDVDQLEFSSDSIWLAIAMRDAPLEIWNWRKRTTLPGDFRHPARSPVHSHDYPDRIAFSPDGATFATGISNWTSGGENYLRLWDLATGKPKTPFMRFGAFVEEMTFRKDSAVIAVKGRGTLILYETSTGLPLGPAIFCPNLFGLGWDRTGQSLFFATYWNERTPEASVRRWWLPRLDANLGDLRAASEFLSLSTVDPTGGLNPLSEATIASAWTRAGTMIRAGITRPERSEAMLLHSWRRHRLAFACSHSDWENALIFSSECVAESPDSWTVRERRGRILAALGRFQEADGELSKALELGGEPDSLRSHRGAVRAELGKWAAAFADFSAVRSHPNDALDVVRTGFACGEYDQVRELLRTEIVATNLHPFYLSETTFLYAALLPEPPVTIEHLLTRLAKGLDRFHGPSKHFLHALVLARADRRDDARAALQKADEMNERYESWYSDDLVANAMRGYVYAKLGDFDQARSALAKLPPADAARPPWFALAAPHRTGTNSWRLKAEIEALRVAAEQLMK